MSTPFVDEYNLMVYLQINGKGLWRLQGYISRNADILSPVPQDSLFKIGYQLTQSSSSRVGNILKNKAQYIINKHQQINKASPLYEAMAEIRNLQAQQGFQGRHISEVGRHQKHCHIKELQQNHIFFYTDWT